MKKLNDLTIKECLLGLKSKQFSSEDVTKACLNEIEKEDEKINAFVTVIKNEAIKQAKEADKVISDMGESAFEKYPLLGVPYALKDNFCTKGVLTTASSNVLKNFIPPYESTVSQKLKDAGAVLLGKTNLDAFAHGSSTESSDFFVTKNPYDSKRVSGGSSGGSAVAVAKNFCIFAIGSETSGSIRQPAAWCGVVGFKPTYGRVSRYGVIAMASSTDSPGPITKTVEDSAVVLKIIAGNDKYDATSSFEPILDYENILKTEKKYKVGVAKSYFSYGVDKEVKEKVMESIERLKKMGHKVVEVDLLDPKYATAVYTIVQRSEVSSNLARFDGIRYGFDRTHFGFEAKKRIMLGTYTLSSGYIDKYYIKAQKVRELILQDFENAFKKVDLIIGPTSPSTATKIGEAEGNSMFGELQDALISPSSLTGITGVSINVGFSSAGLPIGAQIMGNKFKEADVLNLAHQLERTYGTF